MSGEQLRALAKRVPAHYIQEKPGGFAADYISHSEITQMLLAKLGPFDQRIVEVIRSPEGVVDGVVLEMTFEIDGRTVTVQEAGDCDHPSKHNGANLKNAVSSAVNRCAMRVGLGLELWSREFYVLDQALEAKHNKEGADDGAE